MPNKNQIFHVAPLSLVLGAIVSCASESPNAPVPESEVSPWSGPESSATPSARLIEFLNRGDDMDLATRFMTDPKSVFDEFGIRADEREVIKAAGEFKGKGVQACHDAVTSMLKSLAIPADQHAQLASKLVANYMTFW
ncbi:hypothetical protein WME94_01355 [Sorangium sp. So ce429]